MAREAAESVHADLSDLITRAEASALHPSTNQRNRRLLKDLCLALVALAQRCAQVQAMVPSDEAAPSLIIQP